MRKLATIAALGVTAAGSLAGSGGAAAETRACPGQATYLPNAATSTASAALTAAGAADAIGNIPADGSVTVRFTSTVCAGFRLVLRAKEFRPGNKGYPRHDGYTTLINELTHISAGPVTLTLTLKPRGLALLKYARKHNQSLTVFVISHVRADEKVISSEALQIVVVS